MSETVNTMNQQQAANNTRPFLMMMMLMPFVLAAGLHLSAVFKFVAALPLFYAHMRFGRFAGLVASATNMAIVWAVMGRSEAAWFFVLSVVMGAAIAECVKLKIKVELMVLVSIAMMLLASFVLLVSYAQKAHQSPLEVITGVVGTEVDEFVKSAKKYQESSAVTNQDLEKLLADPQETKKNVLQALPSVGLIGLLVMVVMNVLLIIRLNIQNVQKRLGLRANFFKRWKTPDHLVWPTLAVGFCLVVEIPGMSEIALNLFRVLMAIYCIQGLAILGTLMDVWRIKSFLRPLGYFTALTFLLPLVIGLGFFDLWFSFRARFGGKTV